MLVTPQISIPVGVTFDQPAPALSAWSKTEKALKQPGVATQQRRPNPAPHPHDPTTQDLARRLFAQGNAHHPDLRGHWITAEALYGTAPCVDGAAALFGGGQVISQIRSHQNVRVQQREQPVADYCATHPGTPHTLRIRGGQEVVAIVGRAKWYVSSHNTQRVVVALNYEGEDTYRDLLASDLTWRTRDMVQGQTLRWLVEVCVPDWKSHEGWSPLTTPPGAEGARHRVILSLLVDHALFVHPDPHAQLTHTLPAYTGGSLRANVPVACLVNVIENLVSSDTPQAQRHRCTHAFHQVLAFGHAKQHMIQRQLGRLEPTPALKDRADEGMRNIPVLST